MTLGPTAYEYDKFRHSSKFNIYPAGTIFCLEPPSLSQQIVIRSCRQSAIPLFVLDTMADLSALNVLLKATSKQAVEKLINLAFIARSSPKDVRAALAT